MDLLAGEPLKAGGVLAGAAASALMALLAQPGRSCKHSQVLAPVAERLASPRARAPKAPLVIASVTLLCCFAAGSLFLFVCLFVCCIDQIVIDSQLQLASFIDRDVY